MAGNMERELHFLNFVTVFCIGFYIIMLCVLCCIEIRQGLVLHVFALTFLASVCHLLMLCFLVFGLMPFVRFICLYLSFFFKYILDFSTNIAGV